MKKILLPLVLVAGLGLGAAEVSAESFRLAETASTTSTTTQIEMPDVKVPDVTPDTTHVTESVTESIHIDADNNDADVVGLSGTYILIFALIGIALIAVLAAVATRRSTI